VLFSLLGFLIFSPYYLFFFFGVPSPSSFVCDHHYQKLQLLVSTGLSLSHLPVGFFNLLYFHCLPSILWIFAPHKTIIKSIWRRRRRVVCRRWRWHARSGDTWKVWRRERLVGVMGDHGGWASDFALLWGNQTTSLSTHTPSPYASACSCIMVITNERGRWQDGKERKGNTRERIGNLRVRKALRVREPKLHSRVVLISN